MWHLKMGLEVSENRFLTQGKSYYLSQLPPSPGSEVEKISQQGREDQRKWDWGLNGPLTWSPPALLLGADTLFTDLRWTQDDQRAEENVVCLPECSPGDQVSRMAPEQKTSNG